MKEFYLPKMKRGFVGDEITRMTLPTVETTERLQTIRVEEIKADDSTTVGVTAAALAEIAAPGVTSLGGEELAAAVVDEAAGAVGAAVAAGEVLGAAATVAATAVPGAVTRQQSTLRAMESELNTLNRTGTSLNSIALNSVVVAAASGVSNTVINEVDENSGRLQKIPLHTEKLRTHSSGSADNASIVNNSGKLLPEVPDVWVFAGYAMKKSGSAFVKLQTRYFVLTTEGVISYYQSVSAATATAAVAAVE